MSDIFEVQKVENYCNHLDFLLQGHDWVPTIDVSDRIKGYDRFQTIRNAGCGIEKKCFVSR